MSVPEARLISFEDLKPSGARLDECAGGIGIDSRQRVYFAALDFSPPQDVAVFRYDTTGGTRELVGSLRQVTAEQGNLGPCEHWPHEESIAKVHVPFIEHGGKLYFASHDFTGIDVDYRDVYDDLPNHRGAHLYSFDPATDTFQDLTRHAEGGVAVRHDSIVAMDIAPGEDYLAALTFPHGDLVIHDLRDGSTRLHPGMPEYRADRTVNTTRKIIAKRGKVFVSWELDRFWLREVDRETGEIRKTAHPNVLETGYLSGTARSRDGRTVYAVDLTGHLYRFDTDEERLESLGSLLTDEELARGDSVSMVHALALSRDESKVYTLPSRIDRESRLRRSGMRLLTRLSPGLKNRLKLLRLRLLGAMTPSGSAPGKSSGSGLYEYDVATGAKRLVGRFPSILEGAWVTGNGVCDDEGRLYFCYHANLPHSARLVQISGL